MTCHCNSTACKCMEAANKLADNKTASPANYFVQTVPYTVFDMGPQYAKNLVEAIIKDEGVDLVYVHRYEYGGDQNSGSINITIQPDGSQLSTSSSYNPYGDFTTKEIYRMVDGKMTLVKTLQGKIVPPKLEESYEFEE